MLGALLAAGLALFAALGAITVRTDMVDFLPQGQTEAARLVMQEARAGSATGLILMGVEGAPATELARISVALAAGLRTSDLFSLVAGGDAAMPGEPLGSTLRSSAPSVSDTGPVESAAPQQADLFARRYLLAPADFSGPALRRALEGLLRQLRSSTAPLAVQFGLADPPGAFLALIRGWVGDSKVRTVDGAWFAPAAEPAQTPGGASARVASAISQRSQRDADRALLLARTRAGGMDVPAQEAAAAAIEAAFQAAGPGSTRLLVAGPAVFARDAARAIKGDVHRIAIASTTFVALLLWWRFRSPLVIAAIAAPVVLSVAAAAVVVQAIYGAVHGVALGFGATMLGVSVDYPVLLIGHRKRGEPAAATRARIGPAFILAVVTATLGLAAMVLSGFPGLAQLGVFAAVGLATAAVATWWLLPRLVVAANLAPVAAGNPAWLLRVERLRRGRLLGLLPVALAGGWLLAVGGPAWEGDLANLSPVPAASRALDAELRAALGAPDAGQILIVRGADPEAVLTAQEALVPLLDRLRSEGAIAGAEFAARLLPSAAVQSARIAALPDPATLAARLEQARDGLPFRPAAFQPFLDAVDASRAMAPLRPADLAGSAAPQLAGSPVAASLGALLRSRLDPLLFQRDGVWQGPVVLQGAHDPTRLAAAFAGSGEPLGSTQDAVYIDMRAELGGILSGYTARAWRWLGWSALAVLVVLAAGLRDPVRVARVLGAVGAALLATVAGLTAAGVKLSLIHLVALQLVAGVGLDYALFFARRQLDAEERARTLRTLVTCNGMTLLTFGLLAACQTPLLRDIGVTVAAGALAAMAFSFLFAGQAPSPAAEQRAQEDPSP